MTKEIRLNAFDMNCVGHHSARHVDASARSLDRVQHDLEYWQDLARLAERGKFDGICSSPTSLGVYDVYRGGPAPSISRRRADPGQRPDDGGAGDGGGHRTTSVSASPPALTYEPPYPVRPPHVDAGSPDPRPDRLEHRDRLSRQRRTRHGAGRSARPRRSLRRRRRIHVGRLQVVGGELGGRRGAARQVQPDLRRSRPRSIAFGIRATTIRSTRFTCAEPSPQRTPVLYQAGASNRGREFAATHAECVFVFGADKRDHPRSRRRHPPPRCGARARSGGNPDLLQPCRRRRPHRGARPRTSTGSTTNTPVSRARWRISRARPASTSRATSPTSRSAT